MPGIPRKGHDESASGFRPSWWLPGPHLQTAWPVLFRPRPPLNLSPERVSLPDGDFLDIAWVDKQRQAPLILVLHGLEGSIRSHYAAGLLGSLSASRFRSVFMHFRGCSGEPNRLPRGYHSGETGDLSFLMRHIERMAGTPVRAVVGFSLGGNVLLKWLGERREGPSLKTAVAVSVPFRLEQCAQRLDTGLSRIYQRYLLHSLKRAYREKFARIPSPLRVDLARLKTFRDFDDQVTAPLHGFRGVDDYYRQSSSAGYLKRIRLDTLIIHAKDDPFMWPCSVPRRCELSPSIRMELSPAGGHVGFVGGALPWKPDYWLDRRIIRHLEYLHDTA